MSVDFDIEASTGAVHGEALGAPKLISIDGGLAERRPVVARHHSRRDSEVRRLLLAADLVGVCIGLLAGTMVVSQHPGELLWGVLLLPVWVVVFKAYGLYDRDSKRISHGTVDDLPWVFHAVLLVTLLMLALFRVTPLGSIRLMDLATLALVAMAAVLACRSVARHAAASLLDRERVLLIGEGRQVETLARKLAAHSEYGVDVVGLVARAKPRDGAAALPPLVATPEQLDLEREVQSNRVERVVVAHEDYGGDRLFDLLYRCRELGVKLSVLPQVFDALGPAVELDDVEGVTVLGITPPVLPRSSRFLKRAMDLLGSGLLLLLAAPAMLAVAIAVKLDSPGPVLFRQTRIGHGGRRFQLLKFRTMCADAEARRAELLAQSKDPEWLLLDRDPRVTRVGGFLRHSSLDELPQLWNVLRGEMSLVGPRPIVEDEDRQLTGWRRTRIDLTPGITGLWQVLGRTNIPFEEMIKLDYLYVTNWSLWSDVSLMLRTLPAVLLRRGVN